MEEPDPSLDGLKEVHNAIHVFYLLFILSFQGEIARRLAVHNEGMRRNIAQISSQIADTADAQKQKVLSIFYYIFFGSLLILTSP